MPAHIAFGYYPNGGSEFVKLEICTKTEELQPALKRASTNIADKSKLRLAVVDETGFVRKSAPLANFKLEDCYICSKCGELAEPPSWNEETNNKLLAARHCFSCDFWTQRTKPAIFNSERTVRINGTHYHIGADVNGPESRFAGFGGAKYRVKFHDGRIHEGNSLWFNGEIPEYFKDQLPDNAYKLEWL